MYASEPFAAIAAAQGIADFEFDYVGAVPLAKDYGELVLYHVHGVGGVLAISMTAKETPECVC